MERPPLDLSNFTVALRKHVDPSSPMPLRLMAAKGLVPMAPQEMALVLYQLSLDKDSRVATAASETLVNTPMDLLSTAFSADLEPRILDWASEIFARKDEVIQLIVSNPATDDATIVSIAQQGGSATCDLVAENQVRLLHSPRIIEALYMNPKARMSTVDKLVDLARRNGVSLSGLPAIRGLMESDEPIVSEREAPREEPQEVSLQQDALFAHFLEDSQKEERQEAVAKETEGESPEGAPPISRQRYLSGLPVPHKIRFAVLGSREDRNYLIRDPNRLVYMSVISSPKVNEQDALMWSTNRSLPEGVITAIARNREWLRLYQVKVNLMNNPKLPLQTALRILPHLLPKDLKALSRNRNVPYQLARQAKDLVEKRLSRRRT